MDEAVTEQFSRPTYHQSIPTPSGPEPSGTEPRGAGAAASGMARGAATGTARAARATTRRVIALSKADGADESGLTALIWNQVLSYGTDAMITVALAGTVFFGASTSAQRGNILLYLLITMAPFAVVAPVIGPVLDRFQHGRRWTMAATGFGRAILALVMSGHPTDLLVLYPCALGSLVLSKAYGVVRAAAAPRLLPPGLTQNQANARLTIFGLGSTIVFGGTVGVLIKITGSYSFGLFITALAFVGCGISALRLPKQIDSAPPVPGSRDGEGRRSRVPVQAPLWRKLVIWAERGFDERMVLALQGESSLRLLSGMMTIFLAFHVQATTHGFSAAWHLGAIAGGAGLGNFVGTALGTRLRLTKPGLIIVIATAVAALALVLAALDFSLLFIVIAMFASAICNSISKISLDSMIQSEVAETLRSSAFARSETFLQLAWVLGAALGVGLSARHETDGAAGMWVAAAIVGTVAVSTALRARVVDRPVTRRRKRPGSVIPPDQDQLP